LSKTHAEQTVGGLSGHLLRRVVHVAIAATPLLYYAYGATVGGWFHLTAKQILLVIIAISIIFEVLRLKFGWTVFGQRQHEAKRISAFAWGAVSVCLVLLLAPDKRFAIPIVWSCAIVDPILGELRRTHLRPLWIAALGIVAVMLIWWLATWWWQTPWLLAWLMGPLIVWLEWPNFRWIDDNALMQLVPLLVIMLLYG
jgi:hypothetical protein